MHRIDRGRGTQSKVALGKRLGELCVSCGVTNLTTCDVSASLEVFICQMHAKEMIRPMGNCMGTRIRCGGWIRQLYAKIK